MRRYELSFALSLLFLMLLVSAASAEYWFQSGAHPDDSASNNAGGSVEIQTVLPQPVTSGSMAFWVGENLPNDSFLQVGYLIENQSGNFPTNCSVSGCGDKELLKAGDAEWFYEYFTATSNGTFLGAIGPDGSAGPNGAFNTYSFYALGNTWYFMFNNKTVGSIDLGTSSSGSEWPVAVAEVANTSNAGTKMSPVIFSNFSVYKFDRFMPVSRGYATINYGVGSKTNLKNPYGVKEMENRTNYFEAGSGLPTSVDGELLWTLGRRLTIYSPYGNVSSKNSYVAYSQAPISVPRIIYLGNSTRVIFQGWSGKGFGSYTGPLNNTTVIMNSNITETANWQLQYYLNVTSSHGNATGSGWYVNGSRATFSLNSAIILNDNMPPFVFSRWSNGNENLNSNLIVDAPTNISAEWKFRTSLLGKDSNNKPISPSYFTIDGKQFNNTPLLDANETHSISGASFKGVAMPIDDQLTSNSPFPFYVFLPVYDLNITTRDFFDLPVNASVQLRFENGTNETLFSGIQGTVNIPDVPYGYANVTVTHFGFKNDVSIRDGIKAFVVFPSALNAATLILGFVAIMYTVRRYRLQVQAKQKESGKL